MPGDVEIANAGRGLHCAKGRFSPGRNWPLLKY